ncbi:MAG: UDP-N-acetylmuramoyl-L-alanyl-D-glutamate--2,6-diaminopimelate ligase [Clostridium sp.]
MKLKEWLSELKYEMMQGSLEEEVEEVVYDSRKAAEHSVFVCMKGANADSHQFIPDVLKKGTRVFVVEEDIDVPADITVLKVENGRNALSLLSAARFDYPVRKMVSIGVTGTKGKTTSTYMIKSILEAAGEQVGLIGTNGAVIGANHYPTKNTTPESYILQEYFARMVEEGCTYMVMEVSSQSYLMHRVDGIFFDYSIFLNISNDHIGPNEHATFEEYLYYKKQLLQNSGIVLVNRDDEHFESIIEGSAATVKTFALDHAADFMAENLQYIREHDFVGLDFQVTGDYDIELRVNVPGRFNVYNALAAVGVCSFFDLPKERIAHALEHMSVDGRMEIVYKSAKCTVIVDYAHNAVSMESLLKTLRDYHPERLVCVFGCGGNRARDRRYSMGEIGGNLADLSIITADNSRFEKVEDILADIKIGLAKTNGEFLEIPDRREAIEYSIVHAQKGDIIAIIGKGHEDYQEIEGVRYPFLDRSVVEEVVKKWSI